MITVKNSKIASDYDLFGQQLRQARQEKKLSLAEIADKLQINARYLSALEDGRFSQLPAGIYGKKFLHEYARFLGVDGAEALAAQENFRPNGRGENRPQLFSVKKPRLHYFFTLPKVAKNTLIALVLLACLSYLGLCFKRVTSPPPLAVKSPAENLVTSGNILNISGTAEPEAKVMINGEPVLADASGNFAKEINLKTGLNTIIITAQKQYSRKNTVTRQVMVRS